MTSLLRVALGEYDTGFHTPARSLARAADLVARAASAGARLVVLPETCVTGFTMEPARFAEDEGGAHSRALAGLACEHGVWIIAGLARRSDDARSTAADLPRAGVTNSAVCIDPNGREVGVYHKQRLFSYGGEHEQYSSGNRPTIIAIDGLRVSPFICYDLRFPELFRAVAPDIDVIVVIANWPAVRRAHWDVLVRARAIENQCFVVAVNRIAEGGGIEYDGGSVAYDPWGERIDTTIEGESPRIVALDARRVAETRAHYPFLADLNERMPSRRGHLQKVGQPPHLPDLRAAL